MPPPSVRCIQHDLIEHKIGLLLCRITASLAAIDSFINLRNLIHTLLLQDHGDVRPQEVRQDGQVLQPRQGLQEEQQVRILLNEDL